MNNIKAIMIGVGRIGKMHLNLIKNHFPFVEIVALFDKNLSENNEIQADIIYPPVKLATYLKENAVNCALVATSSHAHVAILRELIPFGITTFCEKPISFDLDELNYLITQADKHNFICQVGFNRRFDPDIQNMKKQLDNNVLGRIHLIKITNRDPLRPDLKFANGSGGLFLDFNIHDFDIARYLTNDEVHRVYANGAVLIDEKLKEIDDIDTSLITLIMNKGTIINIVASRETNAGYDQRIEVFGDKGALFVNNHLENNLEIVSQKQTQLAIPEHSFIERYQSAYIEQLRCFFKLVDNKTPSSPVKIDDAKSAIEVALSCKQSLHLNEVIKVVH